MRRAILSLAVAASLVGPAAAQAIDWSGGRDCGHASNYLGVIAYGPTSCSFAKATVNKYVGYADEKTHTFRVHSKVTHRDYTMTCRLINTPDSPFTDCKGANGAHARMVS